ncbi:energy transducer TonB [Flavobacterium hydatis]|uniref:TonB C-terminal domain-containing protein n=1 Tax=Flavobacterium hydatis TaxID=991 RepID=A0A086AP22_FLAHY|nr:hypothetical protein [Flavobacterium hydatis]KFF18436.1 hypothetical protein IW20_05945 [Flavobacterium hydatis]OXA96816.1 hypothetical protein B0A62_06075 [Flavobacterium hydatis]
MPTKHKISIPEPCHENWDKMTPKDNGRFCLSCSKTVVDFTKMLPDEVQHFFMANQNKSVCGRFKNSQLENIIIQIPTEVLYKQTQYHKMFLLALFIAMGTTLFSCQDKNGDKQKIDKIEIVKDSSTGENTIAENKSSYPPPPKTNYEESNSEKPVIMITKGMVIPESIPFEYNIVYNSGDLDILPVPKNGMKEFYKFINKSYIASNQEKISILFVIEKDGSLSNFNIIKNNSKGNGEEIIKILKTAPKWIPGKLNNRIVRSTYTLPI